MKSFLRFILLVTTVAQLTARPAHDRVGGLSHVDDPAQLLPVNPPTASAIEATLAGFEETSGIRILAQFHSKSPLPEQDAKPGVYMKTLATHLGVAQEGVLLVYFADEDDWRLWIGDDLAATFVGHSGTAQQLTRSGAIHETKEAFFVAAHIQAEDALSALKRITAAARPPSAAQRVRLQTEALLDLLTKKLGSHSPLMR
jgi:hypothetical protein